MSLDERVDEVVQSEEEQDNRVTLSNGVVLEVSPPPDLLMTRLFRKYPEPEVPMAKVMDGTKEVLEPNPDDPVYLRNMENRTLKLTEGIQRLTFLKGITIVALPEGMPSYEEDEDWVDEYEELMDMDVSETRTGRYVDWLTFRVISSSFDLKLVEEAAAKAAGVSDEDLAAAEESFRGRRRRSSS